jgi:O-antigen/teichoic acid export membrane protein
MSIIVVRILSPADYGLIAMATALIGFLGLFSELGLGWAVVNASAQEVHLLMLRKVYGLILVVHGAMFGIVLITAPMIAAFFGEDRLTLIIRVIGIQFILVAPSVIPNALLQRDLEFKWRSIIGLAISGINAVVTLVLALMGFGVWSLVFGSLIPAALGTIAINLLSPFLHFPMLSLKGLGKLFKFGGYVAVSRVFLYLYLQADVVIAGRVLGKEQLGYYSIGMHLASLPMQRVSAILNEVVFPAFAHIQNDRERVAYHVLQAIRLTGLCSFPVFWGIGAVAPEIVDVLLGDKWAPAILPLQLLTIVMPLRMIGQLMPPTLQGVGKAKLIARNQLMACATMIAAFLVGAQFGIVGLSLAWLAAFPITFFANLATWLPALGVRASSMLEAIARPAIAGIGMFALVGAARAYGVGPGPAGLIALTAVGVISYAALSLLTNRDGLREARSLVRRQTVNSVPSGREDSAS